MSTTTALAVQGAVLRERREAAGLSQNDLAFQVRSRFPVVGKVSGEQISQYERGILGKARPNFILLAALSEVLGCPPEELAPGLLAEKEQVLALLEQISYFDQEALVSDAVA